MQTEPTSKITNVQKDQALVAVEVGLTSDSQKLFSEVSHRSEPFIGKKLPHSCIHLQSHVLVCNSINCNSTLVLYMQTRNPDHEIASLKTSPSFLLKLDLMTSQYLQKGYSSVVSVRFISSFFCKAVYHHELLDGYYYSKFTYCEQSLHH